MAAGDDVPGEEAEALQDSVRSSMDWNGRVEKCPRTVAALEDQISEAMSNLTLNAVARAPVGAIVPFAHNPVAQAFVDALMSAEAANIGPPSGMSVVHLNCAPLCPNFLVPILLRPVTLPFWEAAVASLKQTDETPDGRTRSVVAVGSPGTGKTSTIPLLIRTLLQRRSTMTAILEVRAESASTFLLFRRAAQGYEGLSCVANSTRAIAELLNAQDTVRVIANVYALEWFP